MPELIFVLKSCQIFKYSFNFYTLLHSRTNVRIYPKRKNYTNECRNKYLWPIYLNIWIYSSHSGSDQFPRPTARRDLWRSGRDGTNFKEIAIWSRRRKGRGDKLPGSIHPAGTPWMPTYILFCCSKQCCWTLLNVVSFAPSKVPRALYGSKSD